MQVRLGSDSACRLSQKQRLRAVACLCCNKRTLLAGAGSLLRDIMSTDMTVATPDTTVDDLRKMFNTITGLPVVESSATRKLVGVVSKKDLEKPGATVGKVRCLWWQVVNQVLDCNPGHVTACEGGQTLGNVLCPWQIVCLMQLANNQLAGQ